MNQLISLFKSQKDVGQAVTALSAVTTESSEIQVLEELPNEGVGNAKTPIIALNPTMFGNTTQPVAAVPANPEAELPLSSELTDFVQRSVAKGGVLLLVEVADADLAKAQSIIRKHHGRILETAV